MRWKTFESFWIIFFLEGIHSWNGIVGESYNYNKKKVLKVVFLPWSISGIFWEYLETQWPWNLFGLRCHKFYAFIHVCSRSNIIHLSVIRNVGRYKILCELLLFLHINSKSKFWTSQIMITIRDFIPQNCKFKDRDFHLLITLIDSQNYGYNYGDTSISFIC